MHPHSTPLRRWPALLAGALPLALPALLWANMAPPPEPAPLRPGGPAGEPAGGLRDVVVEHERLL
ncbi:MAG TPA: hypothetical protein VK358_04470, partial [Longimicrobium sp.]|nr:hypothetical protein [Longimicrobium sp.]